MGLSIIFHGHPDGLRGSHTSIALFAHLQLTSHALDFLDPCHQCLVVYCVLVVHYLLFSAVFGGLLYAFVYYLLLSVVYNWLGSHQVSTQPDHLAHGFNLSVPWTSHI